MKKRDKIWRIASTTICVMISIAAVVMLVKTKKYGRLPLAIGTVFLNFVPYFMEHILRHRMNTPIFVLTAFYMIGPMLGNCCDLYHTFPIWDKLLHIYGGVIFALVGLLLFGLLVRDDPKNHFAAVIFAICFSMAISMVWEIIEFSGDMFFHTDMQDDFIITELNSYMLGDSLGEVGHIESIENVFVNGQELSMGYIDIGLIDTMLDMILESVGAILAAIFCYKKRHEIFIPITMK